MIYPFSRTELLYGAEAMRKFASCRVAVFGLGGVGGYVVEALARSGIGALDLVDHDRISVTNLNRQILATAETVGKYKADAAEERVRSISPDCRVRTYKMFYLPATQDLLDFSAYDYVVDAIDTVTGKLTIIENAKKAGVPVISSMGTGNKVNPAALEVADLYDTSVCPLARIMRRECRKRGIESLKVIYSREEPVRLRGQGTGGAADGGETQGYSGSAAEETPEAGRRSIPGSTAFVPAAAGLLIASEVIRDLAETVFTGGQDEKERDWRQRGN